MLRGFARTVSGSSSASNRSEGAEKRSYSPDKEPIEVRVKFSFTWHNY
jgi:hypothetical protein